MKPRIPALRDREVVELVRDEPDLLALADAIAATAPRRGRRRRTVAALGAATVCAAGIAVAPAFGLHLRSVVPFWAAPSAPDAGQMVFAHGMVLPDERRGLKLDETRRLAVEVFRGDTERLFVAPSRGGGFCYEWATEPGNPGSWADELGGCAPRGYPITLGYDDTRISIVANAVLISSVQVKLSDGRTVEPAIHWVSAPVNAGFILYQPPAQLKVTNVIALRGGQVIDDQVLTDAPITDSSR